MCRVLQQKLLFLSCLFLSVSCFAPHPRTRQRIQRFAKDDVVDVEFEPVQNKPTEKSSTLEGDDERSLLDLSLDLDPQWKDAKIPFVQGQSVIYCNLAFCVDLDGVTYGIGIPCEPAAAITLEQPNGKVHYMEPSENEELVEIMAAKLQELVGDDVFLKNTPKILTISGNLEKYVANNWKEDLFTETVSRETLMDDSDESMDMVYDFFRKEFGDEEFKKALQEIRNEEDDAIDKEILDLFTVPGLGLDKDNVEGIDEMLKDIADPAAFEKQLNEIGQDLDHEGVALKLVGFNFKDGKAYTLVKLLKPFTIVGKHVQDDEDLRFDLLTPEEERLVIPRLEQVAKHDLERAGLSLTEPDD